MAKPALQVCPLCGIHGEVTQHPDGPDLWRFVCSGPHHDGDHTWYPTVEFAPTSERTGVGAELGVYDDLVTCINAQELVEYGIVEYRYAHLNRAAYLELVRRFGHRSLGAKKFTASAFLARALGQLSTEGLTVSRWAKATGYWDYNGKVSAWARPETSDSIPVTSWSDFAISKGFDPIAWPWAR
jgi:hypothetical protein